MISRKAVTVASGTAAALALAATLFTGGPAAAAPGGSTGTSAYKVDTAASAPARVAVRAEFATQARKAGLTASQASAVQGKVNAYLAKLGAKGTQTNFNTIAMEGADLHVTVPGEAHPRGTTGTYCDRLYFCAYSGEWQNGDDIHMYDCIANFIPWFSTGSWVNNQSAGTRPLLTFTDGSTWLMPAAYADQMTGVGWSPVQTINPC